jgi:hypothetical protein
MVEIDPYNIEAGVALDALVHEYLMDQSPTDRDVPHYSTDEKAAEKVRSRLKSKYGAVVIFGRTRLKGRTWFARYETDARDGTEVLAETYPLAISRLALLRAKPAR